MLCQAMTVDKIWRTGLLIGCSSGIESAPGIGLIIINMFIHHVAGLSRARCAMVAVIISQKLSNQDRPVVTTEHC